MNPDQDPGNALPPPNPIRSGRQLAILQAAEQLFGERGYHAVTIRQIADAANVPLALVGYYYGHKQALFQAVFAHWGDLHAECLAALDEAACDTRHPQALKRIVEAFVLPVLRLRHQPGASRYARLLARELVQGGPEAERSLRLHFDPLTQRFVQGLQAALPHAPRGAVWWAAQFALGVVVFHLSDQRMETLSVGHSRSADPLAAPALVRFIVGGIRASLAQASEAALDPA